MIVNIYCKQLVIMAISTIWQLEFVVKAVIRC